MMGNTSEDHDSFESSLVLWEDGSVTARYGYDSAVRRLHEYEVSGIPPDRERAGRRVECWEPYTAIAPNGKIFARRGWECILGRLFAYEQSMLMPEQWRRRHNTTMPATGRIQVDKKAPSF